jgi:perosamine synthetase
MAEVKYYIYQPCLTGNEKKYVDECIESTWISSKGHFISDFEKAFSGYIGTKYAAGVCNGTIAVHKTCMGNGTGSTQETDHFLCLCGGCLASYSQVTVVGSLR